ncbi:MAG: DUF86 domain-containing protein [Elusimicrobia bacterium]|nr:DUF86 domain-containing protein [Elusimicrobiota bacterium]
MLRDYKVYLEDILQGISKINSYTAGIHLDGILEDEKTFDAIIRNLEIIGEAVKHLPDQVRNKNPEIDWKSIAGLRDILIHEYFGIDPEIILDVVKSKLPFLEKQVKKILEK